MSLKERIGSWRSNRKAREKRIAAIRNWNWVAIMKVVAVVCFLAASGAFLRYAEGYVKSVAPAAEGDLKLAGVPQWVNWDLKHCVAEFAGGTQFPLRPDTAEMVARNLARMSWLDDIGVRVTHDSVLVSARWRKPVVRIRIRETASNIYIDQDLVVMDYLPMPHLPIVEAKGVSLNVVPLPGQVFDQGDLDAAVKLAVVLGVTDAKYAPKTPVLEQIASIDVSNFKGRLDATQPHITLWAKDDTQIVWGAEYGAYATLAEASDDEKIAKLYTYNKDVGLLGSGAKYINLRIPERRLHQPVDKYRAP